MKYINKFFCFFCNDTLYLLFSATSKGPTLKKDVEGLLLKSLSGETVSSPRLDSNTNRATSTAHRMEKSQDVLLKQLLQNTVCTTTSGASTAAQTVSFPNVPSLEAQLARPVPPTPSSLIPPLLDETPPSTKPAATKQILSRETSFLSHAVKSQSPSQSKEDCTRTTPSVTSPLLTTLTKPANVSSETVEKPPAKQIVAPTQIPQNFENVPTIQKPIALPTRPIESPPVVQQETLKQPTNIDVPITNTVQVLQQPTQQLRPVVVPTPPTSQQSLDVQQKQQIIVGSQPQTSTQMVTNTEFLKVVPGSNLQPNSSVYSRSQQVIPTVVQQSTIVKPVTPMVVDSAISTQQPQITGTVQPTVPQMMIAQAGHHHSQLPQSTLAPNTVPLTEVKKEFHDDILSGGVNSVPQLGDTKDFLPTKEELLDGSIDDKTGNFIFYALLLLLL